MKIVTYVDIESTISWFKANYRVGDFFIVLGKRLDISANAKSILEEEFEELRINRIVKHDVNEELTENHCKWIRFKSEKEMMEFCRNLD